MGPGFETSNMAETIFSRLFALCLVGMAVGVETVEPLFKSMNFESMGGIVMTMSFSLSSLADFCGIGTGALGSVRLTSGTPASGTAGGDSSKRNWFELAFDWPAKSMLT